MPTYYCYMLKHKATGKLYLGSRTAKNACPSDLLNGYNTSSKLVKQILKREGKRAFDKLILRTFDNKFHCLAFETKMLNDLDARNNTLMLNQQAGDKKFTAPWHDQEYRKKQSAGASRGRQKILNDPEQLKKLQDNMRHAQKVGWETGATPAALEKLWADPEYKQRRSQQLKARWKDPEFVATMYGDCPHCGWHGKKTAIGMYHKDGVCLSKPKYAAIKQAQKRVSNG